VLLLGRLLVLLALRRCSLDGVCSSVKLEEARDWIQLIPTKVFAHLQWSLLMYSSGHLFSFVLVSNIKGGT
jgi:hypothetical protein